LVKVAFVLLALHVSLLRAPEASAQGGVCTLNAGQSPRLRGLRLGMTADQLGERYPRLPALRADEFGQVKTSFGGLQDIDGAAFEGVESVELNFVDDRLVGFALHYKGVPFDSMEQFMAQLRESLKLPGAWVGEGYAPRKLTCEGFEMQAGASSYGVHWMTPYLRLSEPRAEEVVARRAEEKRERARRAFKP
jgi:hypothetical protein